MDVHSFNGRQQRTTCTVLPVVLWVVTICIPVCGGVGQTDDGIGGVCEEIRRTWSAAR